MGSERNENYRVWLYIGMGLARNMSSIIEKKENKTNECKREDEWGM